MVSLSAYGTAQYVRYRSDTAGAAPLDTTLIDSDDDAQRAVTRADVHGEWKTAVAQPASVRPGNAPALAPCLRTRPARCQRTSGNIILIGVKCKPYSVNMRAPRYRR